MHVDRFEPVLEALYLDVDRVLLEIAALRGVEDNAALLRRQVCREDDRLLDLLEDRVQLGVVRLRVDRPDTCSNRSSALSFLRKFKRRRTIARCRAELSYESRRPMNAPEGPQGRGDCPIHFGGFAMDVVNLSSGTLHI